MIFKCLFNDIPMVIQWYSNDIPMVLNDISMIIQLFENKIAGGEPA